MTTKTSHRPVFSTAPALNPNCIAGLAGAKVFATSDEAIDFVRTLRSYGLANYFIHFADVQGHGISFGYSA